jgi:hypothetical protein
VTFETFTAYTVRKALDINEAHQSARYCSDEQEYEIVGSITVADDLFRQLQGDLMAYHEIWTAASALADDRRSKAQGHYHAVAIRSTRGEVMYVDTQGYDYCRYVLIPV